MIDSIQTIQTLRSYRESIHPLVKPFPPTITARRTATNWLPHRLAAVNTTVCLSEFVISCFHFLSKFEPPLCFPVLSLFRAYPKPFQTYPYSIYRIQLTTIRDFEILLYPLALVLVLRLWRFLVLIESSGNESLQTLLHNVWLSKAVNNPSSRDISLSRFGNYIFLKSNLLSSAPISDEFGGEKAR